MEGQKMSFAAEPGQGFDLAGLTMKTGQIYGGVRLVPLIREQYCSDLRLASRRYNDDLAIVSLTSPKKKNQLEYSSYIPHGMIVNWGPQSASAPNANRSPSSTFGAQLIRRDGRRVDYGGFSVRYFQRMVQREDKKQLRMLPLNIAMEGFLALHFGGPGQALSEYSRSVRSRGLSPRQESSYSGWLVPQLSDALRVFEILEDQCGVLVFVGDVLATAFVVAHPEDYRALHKTLVLDCYADLIVQYGSRYTEVAELSSALENFEVNQLSDLDIALKELRKQWTDIQQTMSLELFQQPVTREKIYKLGRFELQRFCTQLIPKEPNHIGEVIVDQHGQVQYLKTFRLSGAQTKRAYLLKQLAMHDWDLEATATALGTFKSQFIVRLENAGFGYLLQPEILRQARERMQKLRRRS